MIKKLLIVLAVAGCAKQVDPVDNVAQTAHQQLNAIQQSLPKECQTKAINEQIKAEHGTIDSIKSTCELQKQQINSEKLRWKWLFIALSVIIAAHIARKVIK